MSIKAILSVALLGVVWPVASVVAEPMPVRSGEHDDFTRLVFYLPEPRDWTLGRTETGYGLKIDGAVIEWDLSSVFAFIPRTRITEVTDQSGLVGVDLACDCHARTFEPRPGIVVVDIVNGPPNPGSPYEVALMPDPLPFPDSINIPGREPSPVAVQPTLMTGSEFFPNLLESRFPTVEPVLPQREAEVTSGAKGMTSDEMAIMRRELSAQLTRAVSQGLLQPADGIETRANDAMPTVEVTLPAEAEPAAAGSQALNAYTAIDRAVGEGLNPGREQCISPGALALVAPGPDAVLFPVSSQNVDLSNPTEIVKLARIYGGLGFGAEMSALLETLPSQTEETRALAAIAKILDNPFGMLPQTERRFSAQVRCDSSATIWAILESGGRELPERVNDAALLRAFSMFSPELRRHLAPALSEGLRMAGQPETAHAVRAAALRDGTAADPAMEMELLRAEPVADDQADEVLAQLTGASEPGLAAMVDLLRKVSAGQLAGTDDLFAEAEALSHEAKGSAEGARVFAALADALAADARFAEAASLVTRMKDSEHAPAYDFDRIDVAFFDRLAAEGRDGEFLYFAAQALAQGTLPEISTDTRLQMAMRFTDLGFVLQARELMSSATLPDGPDRQIAAARIALADREPVEALARIAGVEGEQANRLRAEALIQVGAGQDAVDTLRASGDVADAGRNAWTTGEWAVASDLIADEPRRQLAETLNTMFPENGGEGAGAVTTDPTDIPPVAAGGGVIDPSSVGVLAQQRGLADRSAKLREMVKATLANSAPR
ncbi:MAG: hypothetical protein ACK5IB_12195 [Qingshengfaniella sp.]